MLGPCAGLRIRTFLHCKAYGFTAFIALILVQKCENHLTCSKKRRSPRFEVPTPVAGTGPSGPGRAAGRQNGVPGNGPSKVRQALRGVWSGSHVRVPLRGGNGFVNFSFSGSEIWRRASGASESGRNCIGKMRRNFPCPSGALGGSTQKIRRSALEPPRLRESCIRVETPTRVHDVQQNAPHGRPGVQKGGIKRVERCCKYVGVGAIGRANVAKTNGT